MRRTEVEEFLKAIEFRLGLFDQQLSHEDWLEVRHMFEKRARRDLVWATKYIRKLHEYQEHLEKVVASMSDPATALSSRAGDPSMRVVRGSQPRIDIEPPQRTDDITRTALADAFDMDGYEP